MLWLAKVTFEPVPAQPLVTPALVVIGHQAPAHKNIPETPLVAYCINSAFRKLAWTATELCATM